MGTVRRHRSQLETNVRLPRDLPLWRQPSIALFAVLMLTLVMYPFADSARPVRALAQILDIAVVLSVMRMLRVHALWVKSGWWISVPLIVLQATHLIWPQNGPLLAAMLAAQIAFHAFGVVLLLGYVLRDEIVTTDELFALACIYVLLALLWASAYALVILANPQAIFINPTNDMDGAVGWSDLVYYSMTTLTSTGYGEITPVSPAARALAMLQQVVGVLFVAILIARLTGLNRAARSHRGDN